MITNYHLITSNQSVMTYKMKDIKIDTITTITIDIRIKDTYITTFNQHTD